MTEEDVTQLLAELEELLFSLELNFIVTQERVLAAEGVSRSPTEAAEPGEADYQFDEVLPLEDSFTIAPEREGRSESFQREFRMPRLRDSDVMITPLNNRARLGILLDLIEVATAGTLAMERDVRNQLDELKGIAANRFTAVEEFAPTLSDRAARTQELDGIVVFVDSPEAELRGQTLHQWKLASPGVLATSMSKAQTVTELLNELRVRAGLSRGQWLAPHGGNGANNDVWN